MYSIFPSPCTAISAFATSLKVRPSPRAGVDDRLDRVPGALGEQAFCALFRREEALSYCFDGGHSRIRTYDFHRVKVATRHFPYPATSTDVDQGTILSIT
jgi:hypothetical protein